MQITFCLSPFDHVIIETTGLADPVPIIHTLMTSLDLQRIYSIDGVITVVDTVNGETTYNAHEEAVKQTAFADRIILSKTDIADEIVINSLTKRIKKISPKVTIIKSDKKSLPVSKLLGLMMLVKLQGGVLCIDQSDDGIKPVVLVYLLVDEEGLRHRR